MKENNIKIISRLTYISFFALIISIGEVIYKFIMMKCVPAINYQIPLPFFALTFLGLLILVIDEDKKRLVDNS
jgi:hypothetical protein